VIEVATPSDGISVPAGGSVGGRPGGTATVRGLIRTVLIVPFGHTRGRSLPAASATRTVPSVNAAAPNGFDSSGSPSVLNGSGSVCWYAPMSATFQGDFPGQSR